MSNSKQKARLEETFIATIRPKLKEDLKLSNIMEVPALSKVVLNVGVKEAVSESKALQAAENILRAIANQAPVRTEAKKSIAGFKIREGMQLGVMVTLRGKKMYEFVDRLISLALPKVRDFQGVSRKLDGRGNYNLGIKEWSIFPEAEAAGAGEKNYGMNITFHTSAQNDEHGFALLEAFGMPFRKK